MNIRRRRRREREREDKWKDYDLVVLIGSW